MKYKINIFSDEFAKELKKEILDLINQHGTIPDESRKSEDSELMTTKEAASFYSVHLNTIRSWTKKGILESKKIGNRIYIKKEKL